MSIAAVVVKVKVPLGRGNAADAESAAQIVAGSAKFARRVQKAEVALAGFRNQYSSASNNDHSVWEHQVVLKDVTIEHDLVHFNAHLVIQEHGGDDSFTGSVTAVVIAQLA
jgi:hypothetical protein